MRHMLQNKTFIRGMSEIHTWGGLIFGWLLFAIFLTGTLAVFEQELTHWMQPSLRSNPAAAVQSLAAAEQKLRLFAPSAEAWTVAMPQPRHQDLEISWKVGQVALEKHLDAQTGAVIKSPETAGGEFFSRFHFELHSGKSGLWLVSLASIIMLAAVISGVVIRKQVIKDFFLLRWRQSWLNLHTMTGVLTLPFVLLITYTGLTINFFSLMPLVPHLLYGNAWKGPYAVVANNYDRPRSNLPGNLVPLSSLLPQAEAILGKDKISFIRITNPGDQNSLVTFYRNVDDSIVAISSRAVFEGTTGELVGSQTTWNKFVQIYRSIVGLHIARFGGYPISWLYFAFGLISSVMIAAGLIFFVIKRRRRYAQSAGAAQAMFRSIEALNITAISGLITAIAALLWSNRLLPAAIVNRAEAEINVFLFVWGIMLMHAFNRAPAKAWYEQLMIAGFLCGGLPAISALTTNVGLLPSLRKGDWMTAGVDITIFLFGAFFLFTARMIRRRASQS